MTCAYLDRNTANVSDFQGMGMIGKYSVWCHFRKNEQFLVTKFVKDFDCPVIALPEETAIFIKDCETKVIGSEPAYVFTNKGMKTISIGKFTL